MALTIPTILLAIYISTYVRTQDILRLADHRTYAEDHEAFSEHYGHHQLYYCTNFLPDPQTYICSPIIKSEHPNYINRVLNKCRYVAAKEERFAPPTALKSCPVPFVLRCHYAINRACFIISHHIQQLPIYYYQQRIQNERERLPANHFRNLLTPPTPIKLIKCPPSTTPTTTF